MWVFGGIERVSKKKFIVPLHKDGQDRSANTLIPLIKKFILPGSVIISDGWSAYNTIGNEGYTHKVVNHSENFVDPDDPSVHTQTIERLWRDVKEWCKRPGIRFEYFEQYFARYLFIKKYRSKNLAFHRFFLAAANLYQPLGNRAENHPAYPVDRAAGPDDHFGADSDDDDPNV